MLWHKHLQSALFRIEFPSYRGRLSPNIRLMAAKHAFDVAALMVTLR